MNAQKPRATTALLQRSARALKRHLPSALAGDFTGVHQARVASRRLREAVPVLCTGLEGIRAGKARRKIRRLTRALGTVRELDVTLHLLDDLARSHEVPRAAVEEARAHVITERDRLREVMRRRLDRVDLGKLERRLASVGDGLERARTEPWREALSARLVTRARRLTVATDEAGQMYQPERLHQVRIAAKKLRYGLEIAAEVGAVTARRPMLTLKRAQELLGQLHDFQVLQSHVAAVQAEPAGARRAVAAGLETLARHIEDRCRHLHGQYVSAAPGLRDACLVVIDRVVGQVARGRMRRLPLKMKMAPPRAGAARSAVGRR